MEIYVVTSGSYSDYGIEKVFLDKEKAEHYAEWGGRPKGRGLQYRG